MPTRITFKVDNREALALARRTEELTQTEQVAPLDVKSKTVHFLRGVESRSTFALSSFYLFLGSTAQRSSDTLVEGYPGAVLKSTLEFSSANTISLACRKAFDDGTKGLTGSIFSKTSDETLLGVAQYWSEISQLPTEDAASTLVFLREIFSILSQSSQKLLRQDATLSRRIGLLKQHANRSAAHLSHEPFSFSLLDCAHVVAALTLIGEMIRRFDKPSAGEGYFDAVDAAAHSAATALFPETPNLRLFQNVKVSDQARWCWKGGHSKGRQMLLEQLPFAIGWY